MWNAYKVRIIVNTKILGSILHEQLHEVENKLAYSSQFLYWETWNAFFPILFIFQEAKTNEDIIIDLDINWEHASIITFGTNRGIW